MGDAVLLDLCELGLPEGLPKRSTGHGHHGAYGQTEELLRDADERGPVEACVWYDEESQVVACPPAMTGRELNEFLARKGRMFVGGHCPDVGLGGFLLQGGMGWNCCKVSYDINTKKCLFPGRKGGTTLKRC